MNELLNENEKVIIDNQLNMDQQIVIDENHCDSKANDSKQNELQNDSKVNTDVQSQHTKNDDVCINQNPVITSIDKNPEIMEKIVEVKQNAKNESLEVERNENKKNDVNENTVKSEKNDRVVILIQKEESINNCEASKNVNNEKETNNNEEKLKRPINQPVSQKNHKTTFAVNKSARKMQRITTSSSQAVVYNHSKKQGIGSSTISAQNANPSGSSRKGKIPHSQTAPSNIRFKSSKNGLFERSLKKPTNSDEDSDDYLNFTFTYSNPYYDSKKKPIVSNITSESSIINEVNKRKMIGEKAKYDGADEMNNQQFEISSYNKKLAKRALLRHKEKKIIRNNPSPINDEYDQDVVFLDDQILPDDTEVESKKYKYYRKAPSYLSQVNSFFKENKDIVKATKEQEILKYKRTRKVNEK